MKVSRGAVHFPDWPRPPRETATALGHFSVIHISVIPRRAQMTEKMAERKNASKTSAAPDRGIYAASTFAR
jgi:hypothetical protein